MDDGGADTTARAGDDTGGVVAQPSVVRVPQTIGRYRLGDRLGAGGMGVVYLAYDPVLDRQVAIKVLRRRSHQARGNLEREAQAIARIHHPNVVVVHDVLIDDNDVCVVMQYVRGTTLSEWLAAEARPPRDILTRFLAAGRGLAAAHAVGLVHRDFKPENVLLGDDGAVVVTDFGLARLDATSHDDVESADEELQLAQTRSGSLSGTPRYMSPEQFRGELIDARSDQYNFAVALWLALFQSHPIIPPGGGATLEEHKEVVIRGTIVPPRDPRVVPSRVTAALRRALSVEPAARFAHIDDLLAELAPRHRGRVLALAGAGAVAAGVVFVVASGRGASESRPAVSPTALACDNAGAPIAAVWSAAARTTYLARATDVPPSIAAADITELLAADAATFDAFVAAWTEVAAADCRAPDPRRAACLVDQRDQLAATLTRPMLRRQPILGDPQWCNAGGVHLREIVLRTDAGSAAFSPDGTQIAYATADGARGIVGLDGRPTGTGPALARIMDWTADGITGFDEHGKRVRALPGSPPVPVVEPTGGVPSTKGDRRARLTGETVEILDATGAVVASVNVPRAEAVFSWSPDDRRLVVGVYRHLAIVDIAHARVETLSRITHNTLGFPTFEWRAPDELVVAGGALQGLGDGLWRARFDDSGRVRDLVAVLPPARNRGLALNDVAGNRVLVDRTHLSFATVKVEGGIGTPMSAPVEGVLAGADVAAGRYNVTSEDGSSHLVDAAGNLLDSVRGKPVVVQGGALVASDGRTTCSSLATSRCTTLVEQAGSFTVQVTGPDGPGKPIPFEMPATFTGMDVSADGRRLLVTVNRFEFQVWDLATGAKRVVSVPECRVQSAIFAARGTDVIFAGICSREYQLRSVDMGGRTKVLFTSPDWISGVDHWRDDALVITTRGFRSELVLLDGLPPST